MLDRYANQSLTWKHVATTNKYGESTYTTSTVKGRKETGYKLVRNSKGEEVVSSARVFTQSTVVEKDLIDEKIVVAVDYAIGLNGTVKFYTVYLI